MLAMSGNEGNNWYKLDNAAKIIPGTVKGANTRVFRLTCELFEEVDSSLLQAAVDETVREFPYFNCVLRRGLFWYYLDESGLWPVVTEDNAPACGPLYYPGRRNLLYKVTYFHNRINLEMFHVLADGTGAFRFIRRIIINYLRLAHDLPKTDRADRSSAAEKSDDAFRKYYQKAKGTGQLKRFISTKAFQIRGRRDINRQAHLLEGAVSAKSFLAAAHKYNTTAGVLMTSLFVRAVIGTMSLRDLKKAVSISVPVDLRRFFPSVTSRNFFGVINVVINPERLDYTLEEIIEKVSEPFRSQLSKENIERTMNSYSSFEHNPGVKIVPLFLKELGIQGLSTFTDAGVTASVSNIGVIDLPDAFRPYVKQFSPFMSSLSIQLTSATYNDRMIFGFCSSFEDCGVITGFFRELTDLGIHAEIASNDCNETSRTGYSQREKGSSEKTAACLGSENASAKSKKR